eukprot:SAG31_NODE_1438_length_8338_cov_18.446413_3_plen_147_part_00
MQIPRSFFMLPVCNYIYHRTHWTNMLHADHISTANNRGGYTADEEFEQVMSVYIDADPRQRFFLATDNLSTQTKFLHKYGRERIVLWRSIADQPHKLRQTSQSDALVDLWLLAACRVRHGSNCSSFSQMAHILSRSTWANELRSGS